MQYILLALIPAMPFSATFDSDTGCEAAKLTVQRSLEEIGGIGKPKTIRDLLLCLPADAEEEDVERLRQELGALDAETAARLADAEADAEQKEAEFSAELERQEAADRQVAAEARRLMEAKNAELIAQHEAAQKAREAHRAKRRKAVQP